MTGHYPSRVPPYGNPRLNAYLRLPSAYRSLSRPSSAISAMASTLRSCSLDLRLAIQIFDLNHSVGSRRLAFPSEIRSMPVHIDYCFLRLLRAIINLDCLFRFIPVQFSRCVEVSTFQSILQNDTEIIILSPVKSRRWLRWPTIIFGTFAPLLPVFPAPSLRFQSVDLGYEPLFRSHFSLERR